MSITSSVESRRSKRCRRRVSYREQYSDDSDAEIEEVDDDEEKDPEEEVIIEDFDDHAAGDLGQEETEDKESTQIETKETSNCQIIEDSQEFVRPPQPTRPPGRRGWNKSESKRAATVKEQQRRRREEEEGTFDFIEESEDMSVDVSDGDEVIEESQPDARGVDGSGDHAEAAVAAVDDPFKDLIRKMVESDIRDEKCDEEEKEKPQSSSSNTTTQEEEEELESQDLFPDDILDSNPFQEILDDVTNTTVQMSQSSQDLASQERNSSPPQRRANLLRGKRSAAAAVTDSQESSRSRVDRKIRFVV